MKIESIDYESFPESSDTVITTVVINEVASQCILARLMIEALGKPGKDNDMEFMGSGDRWIISWTTPQLTQQETRELVSKAIGS